MNEPLRIVSAARHLMLPLERTAAIETKRRKILNWFRGYPWSHVAVLTHVTGLGTRAVEKTLVTMERDGLVKRATISAAHARGVCLWGITHHGVHHAFELNESIADIGVFEPSKIAATTLEHDISVQSVHARGVKSGWTDWRPASAITAELIQRHLKVPDAIAVNPSGQRTAIEFERTLKSGKRYAELLVSYLEGRKLGLWSSILYLSPTSTIAARVERAYKSVRTARHKGQTFNVQPVHLAPFSFQTAESFCSPAITATSVSDRSQ